jgi:DNA-binding NarL/FixJ family response regulator
VACASSEGGMRVESCGDVRRAGGQAGAWPPSRRAAAALPGMAGPLTDRELEVLQLLAAGSSNQRIAHCTRQPDSTFG